MTLQKDLGGFNNIRLSLECGVAFAAATGRTFVIPPPFLIWNMNSKMKEKVRSLSLLGPFHFRSTMRNRRKDQQNQGAAHSWRVILYM